jgi:hypothetical protein
MYGPPPDPRQVALDLSPGAAPLPYLVCAAVGVALTALAWWRRPPAWLRGALFVLGQVVLLTMPLAAVLDDAVFGAFPTIDKEGSLLFYLDGVHRRVTLDPLGAAGDPAARLIGVHVGHLWVTALFDLVLTPLGAFNAQALLYPALGWGAAALLLRAVCDDGRVAVVLGMPFGMGLHVFRDLNWYTIEKAAVFWLALFAWGLYRSWRDRGAWPVVTGLLFGLMSWMNLYLGMVGAAVGGLALAWVGLGGVRDEAARAGARGVAAACGACVLTGLPLALWQHHVMSGGPALATPERFLAERAALDGVSLWPPAWNRLEVWRALDPVGAGLAAVAVVRRWGEPRVRFAALAGLVLFVLSLGPAPVPGAGVPNPLYMAAWHLVPGFWRVAKPEVFFEGTWLLMLALAAVELAARRPSGRTLTAVYGVMVVGWLVAVRAHPVYPGFSALLDTTLDSGWQRRVFGAP